MKLLSLIAVSVAVSLCSALDLLQTAGTQPSLSRFLSYVYTSGLNDTLTSPGPLTVFAPTNDAFENVSMPTSSSEIASIIQGHIVEGNLSYAMLNGSLNAMNGAQLAIESTPAIARDYAAGSNTSAKTVNKANLVQSDLYADNGIIHIIDKVLMPAANATAAEKPEAPEAEPEPAAPGEEAEPEAEAGEAAEGPGAGAAAPNVTEADEGAETAANATQPEPGPASPAPQPAGPGPN